MSVEVSPDQWLQAMGKVEKAKRKTRHAWMVAVGALAFSLTVLIGGVVLFFTFRDVPTTLARGECVSKINGTFFGHLADALSREPATLSRQRFLDLMKEDAKKLRAVDVVCPS